jgi:hypothetical protein
MDSTTIPAEDWTPGRLLSLKTDQIPEDFRLDYKGADALPLPKMPGDVKEAKRAEIGKDVTAFANSDGGVIIYGIREAVQAKGRAVPGEFDPVSTADVSRDQLAQLIAAHSEPTLVGFRVHPVQVPGQDDPSQVCYVVEIPKSDTAHMASDGRYYYRNEATTKQMRDWQVRDAMNRRKFPKFSLDIQKHWTFHQNDCPKLQLWVQIANNSGVTARLYRITVKWPKTLHGHDTTISTKASPSHPIFGPSTLHDFVATDGAFGPYFPGFIIDLMAEIICPRASATALFQMRESNEEHLEIEMFADDMPMQTERIAIKQIREREGSL